MPVRNIIRTWLLIGCLLMTARQGNAAEPPGAKLLTGKAFTATLDQPCSASWQRVEFREILEKISAQYKVAIILDRRIDPNFETELEVPTGTLAKALETLAGKQQAAMTVLGNVAFVGPRNAISRLRTVAALRNDELAKTLPPAPRKRREQLAAPFTLIWTDLATPQDLVAQLGKHYALDITGPDKIPHDLWKGASLPEMTLVDSLTAILAQFDLTFRWKEAGQGIEIIPLPGTVSLERKYPAPRSNAAERVDEWRAAVPGLTTEVQGSQVVVQGTLEQHEALERLIATGRAAPARSETKPAIPLNKRKFTLRARNVPVRSLMAELEKSGIRFEYDEKEFRTQNIDLTQTMSVDVEGVTAQQLFKLMFDPLKIQYEIREATAVLTPKPQ